MELISRLHTDHKIYSVCFPASGNTVIYKVGHAESPAAIFAAKDYDLAAAYPLPIFGYDKISDLACHPTRPWLAVAGRMNDKKSNRESLLFWDLDTNQVIRQFEGAINTFGEIGFTPDGNWFIASTAFHGILIYNVWSGTLRLKFPGGDEPRSIAFHPDSNRFIAPVSSESPVKLRMCALDFLYFPNGMETNLLAGKAWGGAEWEVYYDLWAECCFDVNHDEASPSFSPDGHWLAISHNNVAVYSFEDRKLLNEFGADGAITAPSTEYDLIRGRWWSNPVFAPDGTLYCGSPDGIIRRWEIPSGRILNSVQAHTSNVHRLYVSPDGQVLASTGMDRTIKLWRLD